MPSQLVREAIEQSRSREPLVHAMTLLTGARVLAFMDLRAAERVFADGVDALSRARLDDRTRALLTHEAAILGVPASPAAAIELYKTIDFQQDPSIDGTALIAALARQRETTLALELLEDIRFPAGGAEALVSGDESPAFQARLLQAAMNRWRLPRPIAARPRIDRTYSHFSRQYQALPAEQAAAFLDELMEYILSMEDHSIDAKFGDGVRLHTVREVHLFELLNVVRALKPVSFIEELLWQYPALAAGAVRYPNGLDSMAEQQHPPSPPAAIPNPGPNRYTAIPHLLSEAHHLYLEDIHANNASRVLWPSAHAYNLALHEAGKQLGMPGRKHLAEIPDTDLAIRATNELAAGILGLSRHHGLRRSAPAYARSSI